METNHTEKWRSWDLRFTLCSTRFVIKCVGVSRYKNLKEVQCLVMNTENELSVFFENLTLAILLACMCGMLCRSWLRHCASHQKVPISILNGVIGIFH